MTLLVPTDRVSSIASVMNIAGVEDVNMAKEIMLTFSKVDVLIKTV